MIDQHHGWNKSIKPVFIGCVLSALLTIGAYRIGVHHSLTYDSLVITLIILGCVQGLVQFIFFLHLGLETKPRWNLMMFWLMTFVIFVLVVGSIWIMKNIRYNLAP